MTKVHKAVLISLFVLMAYLVYTGYAIHQNTDRTLLIAAIWWHIAFGLMAIVPILIYGVARASGWLEKTRFESDFLSWLVNAIAALSVLLTLSGMLTVWSRGSPLKVFDWLVVPSPVERMNTTYEALEMTHGLLGFAASVCLVLFIVLGAISLIKGAR